MLRLVVWRELGFSNSKVLCSIAIYFVIVVVVVVVETHLNRSKLLVYYLVNGFSSGVCGSI